jgi:hypothetical protein
MVTRRLQVAITLVSAVFLLAHLRWPTLQIDAIAIVLLVLCFAPWLGNLFKSLEMPGGWKIDFNENRFTKAAEVAEESGLLVSESASLTANTQSGVEYTALLEAYPRLAVLDLRIDIEKRVRKLAVHNGITDRKASATTLTRELAKHGVLTGPECVALLGILASLNSVVHGADISKANAEQVLEVGKRLIDSLDERSQSTEAP